MTGASGPASPAAAREHARQGRRHPIVVLTPVRNEAPILERFLAVTSTFADLILIADQGSTDGSREICRRWPRVESIDNDCCEYDEAVRQRLLLAAARATVPGPKVLLALDADEILAADAPATAGWRRMLAAAPGTVLCFEKPDLYRGTERCLRFDRPWPLGYVDDGAEHVPRPVHSLRLPTPAGSPRLVLRDVKVLHYALTRLDHQAAKVRYYAVVENLRGSSPLARRRRNYARRFDWTRLGRLERVPPEWLAGWQRLGIDVRTVASEAYYWQDFEVLRAFARRGTRRFWLDDIWGFDWEACRRYGLRHGVPGLPASPVAGPPRSLRLVGAGIDLAAALVRRSRRALAP